MASIIAFPQIIPDRFTLDLLGEYFQYLSHNDLLSCALVCKWFRPSAYRVYLRCVDLDDQTQVRALLAFPYLRSNVHSVSGPLNFGFAFHRLSVPGNTLMPIRRIELYGPHSMPSSFLLDSIRTFSATLESFTVHASFCMPYRVFVDLIQVLGLCPNLSRLTLPCPSERTNGCQQCPDPHSRAEEAEAAYHDFPPVNTLRPRLKYLQIITTRQRRQPELDSPFDVQPTAPEWGWLAHPNSPFELRYLKEIVIGDPAAAQLLFPLARASLARVEFSAPGDMQKNRYQPREYSHITTQETSS